MFSRRKTTALSTIEFDGILFSLPTVVWFSDREIVKESIRRIKVFKDSKTKPKYSIRKYSIGAASALIGLMTLAHGQVAHADEAQSISDLTNASNQAQAPQTASTAQLATSELTSEIVQTSQPANIMPSQPKVTTVQPAEQTPTIDQMVETVTPQNQETSANVLTNATEDQGQGKEYNTDNYGAKMPYTSHEAENATIENGATIQQSTDMESTAMEATNQTYVELPKKDAAVTFNVTEPANALNVRYTIPDGASGQLDVQVNGQALAILICHLTQPGSTLKVIKNMIKLLMVQVRVFVLMKHVFS